MRIAHYLRKLRTLPPGEIARKARTKVEDRLRATLARRRGYRLPTYSLRPPAWLDGGLARLLPLAPRPADPELLEAVRQIAGRALAHEFNLLGSGWKAAASAAGLATEGRVNASNQAESRRIAALLDPGYIPIDWQADFKSGHRWRSDLWHADLAYGSAPGTDVKVPWELSRMQHLAQLAFAFGGAREGTPGFGEAEAYLREFRNQVLDFISANPPGFGVNWACTMDVAIRVAGWATARDLLLAQGAALDADFERVLARSVYEHGYFIIRNLEWGPGMRGNHYLADIAGLAVAAAYLPPAEESDAWLAFAVRELIGDARIQFHPDGTNFEASTCYHRLSAEMLAYATALIAAQPAPRLAALAAAPSSHRRHFPRFFVYGPLASHAYPGWPVLPFPPWYLERLERSAEFTRDITRPDGRVPQFGDNDSGRFLKLFPRLDPEGNEEILDHRHLVAAVNGLFGRTDLDAFAGVARAETALVAGALAGRRLPTRHAPSAAAPGGTGPGPAATYLVRYPDFGLFLAGCGEARLAFRCGPIGQLGNGGHAHNDQLSFELSVGGTAFLEDPGTYLYTADWPKRNHFRSTAQHNTLAVEGLEQDPWENTRPGLFALISRSRAEAVRLEAGELSGRHFGFGSPHERTLRLEAGRLTGADACGHPGRKTLAFHFAPGVRVAAAPDGGSVEAEAGGRRLRLFSDAGAWSVQPSLSSPAYGVLRQAATAILGIGGETAVKWYIEWSHG